jgi:phosphohistidine phosphatase
MKTLLILRHAKSCWKQPDQTDHDRPLNERGKRDAPRMGQLLNELECPPELIVSSTAKRARKTAAKVAKAGGYRDIIELDGTLYLAPPDRILQVVHSTPNRYQRIMLVGHNPGMQQLLHLLTGTDLKLPTAALARVDLDVANWADVQPGAPARLVDVWRPKELED